MFSAARGPLPVQAFASAQRTFEIKPVTLPSGRGISRRSRHPQGHCPPFAKRVAVRIVVDLGRTEIQSRSFLPPTALLAARSRRRALRISIFCNGPDEVKSPQ